VEIVGQMLDQILLRKRNVDTGVVKEV